MNNNIGVIVGGGSSGQSNIVSALNREGVPVRTVNKMWPRDHYVYFNEQYIESCSPGAIDGNAFGEGGKTVPGDHFLLVSDMAYMHTHIRSLLPENSTYDQIREAIASEGRRILSGTRIHVAPTGYFHGAKGHAHIDMYTLLLLEQRLLLLDTFYGKNAGIANEYDAIAEQEGLRLIKYDGSQDGVWYPLNSLVLPEGIIVVDDKAKSLIRLLQDEGLKTIGVEMPQHTYPGGKIRCQTNTHNLKDNPLDYLAKSF